MKKILFLTRNFPPMMTEGSTRSWQLASHLEAIGWHPLVIGPAGIEGLDDNPDISLWYAEGAYTLYNTGQAVVGDGASPEMVQRLLCGMPVNAFSQLKNSVGGLLRAENNDQGWEKIARESAQQLIAEEGEIELIYAQGPPVTPHMLGLELAKKHGLPLVLDFLAPYDVEGADSVTSLAHHQRFEKLEEQVMQSGHAIIVPSRSLKIYFLKKYFGHLTNDDIRIVSDGYDPEDALISGRGPKEEDAVMRWIILAERVTRKELAAIFAAVSELLQQHEELRGMLSISMIGSQSHEAAALCRKYKLDDVFTLQLQCSRSGETELCSMADLCLAAVGRGEMNEVFVPERLFDIIGIRLPLLGFLHDGATRQVVEDAGGRIVEPGSRGQLAGILLELVEQWRNGQLQPLPDDAVRGFGIGKAIDELHREIVSRLPLD
ncbi:MAG: hypothetical protein J7D60_06490 [Prosthecochloris sp.]|nr:hypothetical protein [Prosthecochloris sp.]